MGDPPPLKLKREAPAGSAFDTVQPNPEFTEMLVGMGFPLNLAQAGLSAVKNHSVDRAMDWIEQHRLDPEFAEQPARPVTVPAQSVAAAAPVAEPTPVFTPMSRLAQTAEERRRHEEKERLAELAKMQREKAEAEAHKARVKAQFEEDRKARSKAAASATAAPAPSAAPALVPAAKPAAKAATEALLQIRLPSGDSLRHTFPASATIADVHTFVAEKIRTGNFNIIVPTPPRKEYNLVQHANLKLSETDLCPRASVNIILTAERGQVLSATSAPPPAAAPPAPVTEGDAVEEDLSYEQMLELEEKMGKVDAGLSPALVATFPVVAYRPAANADEKSTKCFVCREDFQANERVRLLPCLHTFHQKCIDKWFEAHKTCPMDNLRLDAAPS